MIDFPFFYKQETLLKTDFLLLSLKEEREKLFNKSLSLKLEQKNKLPLLLMLFNYSLKNSTNEKSMLIFNLIVKEHEKIKYEKDTGKVFIKLLKSVLKINNGILFNKMSYKINEFSFFYENQKDATILYNMAIEQENEAAIITILNSRLFCWSFPIFDLDKTYLPNILKLVDKKRYDLCHIVLNSSSFLGSYCYNGILRQVKDRAYKNGDLSIFEEKEDHKYNQVKINYDEELPEVKRNLLISLKNGHIVNFEKIFNKYIDKNQYIRFDVDESFEILEKLITTKNKDLFFKVTTEIKRNFYSLTDTDKQLERYECNILNLIIEKGNKEYVELYLKLFGTRSIKKEFFNLKLLNNKNLDHMINFILSKDSFKRLNFLEKEFDLIKIKRTIKNF